LFSTSGKYNYFVCLFNKPEQRDSQTESRWNVDTDFKSCSNVFSHTGTSWTVTRRLLWTKVPSTVHCRCIRWPAQADQPRHNSAFLSCTWLIQRVSCNVEAGSLRLVDQLDVLVVWAWRTNDLSVYHL